MYKGGCAPENDNTGAPVDQQQQNLRTGTELA